MSTLDNFLQHPIATLERALHLRRQIDQLNEVLKELFGPSPVSLDATQKAAAGKRGGRRRMSAAARAKIAAAQRARWARSKGTHGSETAIAMPAAKSKKRKGMSAEGRARIAAAQKARWARVKAQQSTATIEGKTTPVAKKRKKRN
jgi:hypothetical protein